MAWTQPSHSLKIAAASPISHIIATPHQLSLDGHKFVIEAKKDMRHPPSVVYRFKLKKKDGKAAIVVARSELVARYLASTRTKRIRQNRISVSEDRYVQAVIENPEYVYRVGGQDDSTYDEIVDLASSHYREANSNPTYLDVLDWSWYSPSVESSYVSCVGDEKVVEYM
jgi:hypothetical protein